MNKAYRFYLAVSNKVLAGLLTLLGFSIASCESNAEEYGSPYANYEIKGKVVNRQNVPIPNIQIAFSDSLPDRGRPYATINTDTNGEFLWKTDAFPGVTFKLVAKDMDGNENGGLFATDSTFVSFKDAKYENGDRWYKGEAKQEITIVMNEQKNTEE